MKKRLSVYYSQYLDRQITSDNSLLLTSDLTPIVALVNEKRSYLGGKYSNCTPDKGSNDFWFAECTKHNGIIDVGVTNLVTDVEDSVC